MPFGHLLLAYFLLNIFFFLKERDEEKILEAKIPFLMPPEERRDMIQVKIFLNIICFSHILNSMLFCCSLDDTKLTHFELLLLLLYFYLLLNGMMVTLYTRDTLFDLDEQTV